LAFPNEAGKRRRARRLLSIHETFVDEMTIASTPPPL
jgi:hypothetical protein